MFNKYFILSMIFHGLLLAVFFYRSSVPQTPSPSVVSIKEAKKNNGVPILKKNARLVLDERIVVRAQRI